MPSSVRAHLRNGEPGLARAAGRALLSVPQEPAVAAEINAVLARALVRCGDVAEALRCAELGWGGSAGWESAVALCEARLGAGRPDAAVEAAALAESFVGAIDADGAGAASVEAVCAVGIARAEALRAAGRAEEALAVARRVARLSAGLPDPERGEALHTLGAVALAADELDAAREALEAALKLREGGCDAAATLDLLGALERRAGFPERSVKLHHLALDRYAAHLGPRSAPEAGTRHLLAQALRRTGDFAGALEEMTRAADLTARRFGPDHPDTWISRFELGRLEMDNGSPFEGMARMEEARREVVSRLGHDHPVARAMKRWL